MGLLELLTDALDSLEAQAQKGFSPYGQKPAQGAEDIYDNQAEASSSPVSPPVSKREEISPAAQTATAAQPIVSPLFSSGQIASGIIMAEILSKPVSMRRGRGRRGLDG